MKITPVLEREIIHRSMLAGEDPEQYLENIIACVLTMVNLSDEEQDICQNLLIKGVKLHNERADKNRTKT